MWGIHIYGMYGKQSPRMQKPSIPPRLVSATRPPGRGPRATARAVTNKQLRYFAYFCILGVFVWGAETLGEGSLCSFSVTVSRKFIYFYSI